MSNVDRHAAERSRGQVPGSAVWRAALSRVRLVSPCILGVACSLVPLGCIGSGPWGGRPPRTACREVLFGGLVYERRAVEEPVPQVIHAIEIDLSTPGLDFLATPGDTSKGMEARAMTTSQFLARHGVQVAINGTGWRPFHARTWWDYYPHAGDPIDIVGLAISDGIVISPDDTRQPKLCFVGNRPSIVEGTVPQETTQALASGPLLLRDGQILPKPGGPRHPRTAVGISADGAQLWLVVVDGRQAGYSEGATVAELATILRECGAANALNLDGGGSTTMVVEGPDGTPRVLNSPIHTGIRGRQRPVANHLGVRIRRQNSQQTETAAKENRQ